MSDEQKARMHVAQAYTHAISPSAREHLRAALRYLEDGSGQLAECPECGRVGLAERVADGACCQSRVGHTDAGP